MVRLKVQEDNVKLKMNNPNLFSGDYDDLTNKPSINGNTLEGDKTAEELGITGGMNITVNGTDYPITAIILTTISGVEGVLVNYDDENGGQLFFADGVGLNTVKTVIEDAIPHDTSDLTNGAGFLTISDLPIYNGGVE